MDHAAAEAAMVDQLESDVSVARQRPVAAAHDDRVEEQVVLVDEAGPDRLSGESRPADADVSLGLLLEPPDRLGIELPLDVRLRAGGVVEGSGEDDLLGAAPDLRIVAGHRRL